MVSLIASEIGAETMFRLWAKAICFVKPKSKLTNEEPSERFKEAARKLGVEESADFEGILTQIILPKNAQARRTEA